MKNTKALAQKEEKVRDKMMQAIAKRYSNAGHWTGSYMAALETAFELLKEGFEKPFHLAIMLSPSCATTELDVHRAWLRTEHDKALQFYRQCWKDKFEAPNDTAYWKKRCELAEKAMYEMEAPEVPSDHSQAIAVKEWLEWKDKQAQ